MKTSLSIFAIWFVHVVAIVGIYLGFTGWFVEKTWLNLLFITFLVWWNFSIRHLNNSLFAIGIIVFAFLMEWIGVKTGFPFGEYTYGENLGWKLNGVPVLIGFNWLYLSLGTRQLAGLLVMNPWLKAMLASLFMVITDVLIEPVAELLDYWKFQSDSVPIQNYISWFVISFIIQVFINFSGLKEKGLFSIHLIFATILYFGLILVKF